MCYTVATAMTTLTYASCLLAFIIVQYVKTDWCENSAAMALSVVPLPQNMLQCPTLIKVCLE